MTLFGVDIASYQQGLRLANVKAAGFSWINVKLTHGMGYLHAAEDRAGWIAEARRLGLGVSTFHWLDRSGPGDAQARHHFAAMQSLGGPAGWAHQLDCESDATWAIWSDYVTTMQQLLGRHVAAYTGDWWIKPRQEQHPDRWGRAADLTPYAWAAPNDGYRTSYPGDDSRHWDADWGGWDDLSILQYALEPLPGGRIKVSQSAIRDPAVWAVLTGGDIVANPNPARITDPLWQLWLGARDTIPGVRLGGIYAAKAGYHNTRNANAAGDYSVQVDLDRQGPSDKAAAIDLTMSTAEMRKRTDYLRRSALDPADPRMECVREYYGTLDGVTVHGLIKDNRAGPWRYTTSDDSHLWHIHISLFRADVTDWEQLAGVLSVLAGEPYEEDDMPLTDADITKVQKACEAALKNNTLVTNPYRPAEEKATTSVAQMSKNVGVHGLEVRQVLATLQALADRVEVLAGAEAARDEQAAARLAEQLAPAVMGAIREELDDLPPEQLAAAVDQALRSVLTELGKPKPAAPTT